MRADVHEPATKADLREITSRMDAFATKTDLREITSRMDAFATKTDLSEMAARMDSRMDAFATKTVMQEVISRLDGHDQNLRRLNANVVNMQSDMTEMKGKMGAIHTDLSRVSDMLERLNGNMESSLRKHAFQGSMVMEHEERIKKIESRLN